MMRALPAACLWLLGLLPAAVGQEAFSDPDFDFRMQLPVGMRTATEEERAVLFNVALEQARNVPRGEAAGAPITHSYIWLDETTPYNRQILLGLSDGMPPYKNPTELKEAQVQSGLAVEVGPNLLPQPANTVYVEGTFLREPDKIPLRRILLYIADFGAKRYAMITLQAFEADWDIVKSDFDAVVASVRMKLTKVDPSRLPAGAGKTQGAPVTSPNHDSWSSLPVAGSLALAAILIGSLVLGRRKPA